MDWDVRTDYEIADEAHLLDDDATLQPKLVASVRALASRTAFMPGILHRPRARCQHTLGSMR